MDIEKNQASQPEERHSVKVWLKILPYFRVYWKSITALFLAMLTSALIGVAYTLLSGYAVDRFVTPRVHQGITAFALLYLGLVVLKAFTELLLGWVALRMEVNLSRDLRRDLFAHLQALSFSYYNQTPVGVIVARVMSDASRIGGFTWNLVDGFYCSLYVAGCVAVMLAINWKLALLVLCVSPVVALVTLYFEKRILKINRQVRKINAEVTRHYNEGISGAKTSKTMVIEDKNTAAFQEVSGSMRRSSVKAVFLDAVYVPIISFLTALSLAFVLTGGGGMALAGGITIGELTIFEIGRASCRERVSIRV